MGGCLDAHSQSLVVLVARHAASFLFRLVGLPDVLPQVFICQGFVKQIITRKDGIKSSDVLKFDIEPYKKAPQWTDPIKLLISGK